MYTMRDRALPIVESTVFQRFIIIVIVLNSITIGVETFHLPEGINRALVAFDALCLGVYVIELSLKFVAYGRRFFKDPWNVFDLIIVLVCLVPAGIIPVPVQVFRIVRIFRVFRLISAFKQMRVIVEALGKSIPGVCWTAFLLVIVYYIFAVIGVSLFGQAFPDWFGTVGRSFYTLFQVMTLESWSMGISRPVMEVYPMAWLYFVPFVMISAFIIINVVVGIIVGTIDEANQEIAYEEAQVNKESLESEFYKLKSQMDKVETLIKGNKE